MLTLANFVRRNRGEKGLTQKELADQLGTEKTHISKIERGLVKSLNAMNIAKLAKIFDCPIEDVEKAAGRVIIKTNKKPPEFYNKLKESGMTEDELLDRLIEKYLSGEIDID